MIKKTIVLMAAVVLLYGGTVVDNETGLMWQDESPVKKEWEGAKNYCRNLSYDGYSDWRLPNIDELVSITDKNRYKPAVKPIFHHTKSGWYWSSSPVLRNSSKAWGVNFDGGGGSWYFKSDKGYVRCVRGRQ